MFGVAWGLWDWWKTTQRKIVSLLAFIAIGAFIGCILLKQAPMDVAMESLESDYPPGAEVVGIQWQSIFSELRATVTNQSNDIYSDIDILVRTDLTIPEVGIIARFGQCVAEPVKVLEADVHWESGGKKGDLRHGMKGAQVLLAPFIKFIAIDYSLKTEWKLSFPW